MKLNAGGQKRNEPLHLEAVRNRLEFMNYHLHYEALKSEDFENICDLENILIFREPRKWDGAFFKRKNQSIIYIKQSLTGPFRTFVEFHELAHFWLHQPEISSMHFFKRSRMISDKTEHQASVVSACMLIPTVYVESFSYEELMDLFIFRDVVDFRLRVYRDHQI